MELWDSIVSNELAWLMLLVLSASIVLLQSFLSTYA